LQCPSEGLDRRDVGLGCALTHGHAQPGAAEIGARPNNHAVLDQRVDDRRIPDDNIETFAGFDLRLDLGIHPKAQVDLVAGGALELGAQLAHRGPGTVAAQNLKLNRVCGRSDSQQRERERKQPVHGFTSYFSDT